MQLHCSGKRRGGLCSNRGLEDWGNILRDHRLCCVWVDGKLDSVVIVMDGSSEAGEHVVNGILFLLDLLETLAFLALLH